MNHQQMTSPCGLDCFNCDLYKAKTDEVIRENIVAKLAIDKIDAFCNGCRNQAGKIEAIGRNQPCYIYKCTQEKEIDFCYECDDFPCDNLHPYADQADQRPHNTKLFNLCTIKKIGLEKWAVEKAHKVKETYFNGKIKLND